ncbi:MAG TPA: hypothetical protein VFZ59_17090 [Verrucomicrobiae bacterium]|nr:hypothetical protein [Verrucomicrobiae bacterium]
MTKLIWALIIAAVAFVGYRIYLHWAKIQEERGGKVEAPVVAVSGDSLPGMPAHLDAACRAAREKSPAAFRAWFAANENLLSDPRKAWIELDLCVAIRRDDPSEARGIFARVQKRVGPSSPVFPRIKELERAFQ